MKGLIKTTCIKNKKMTDSSTRNRFAELFLTDFSASLEMTNQVLLEPLSKTGAGRSWNCREKGAVDCFDARLTVTGNDVTIQDSSVLYRNIRFREAGQTSLKSLCDRKLRVFFTGESG